MTEWDDVVNSPNPPTIPAPWESLTKALPYRGWQHGKLTLIAARAGDGLTTMGLEAARGHVRPVRPDVHSQWVHMFAPWRGGGGFPAGFPDTFGATLL